MTAALMIDNLLAWSAQVCVLSAVAALAALTLKHPKARLVFWQGILAIALLLPAVEPKTRSQPDPGGVSAVSSPVRIPSEAPRNPFHWRREYLLWMLAAGWAFRAGWIGIGLLRLRWYRLSARALDEPPLSFDWTRARWYTSDSISGPVTFGWLRPSILLPARMMDFSADLREAICCHELTHIARRDWLFVLAEELIRSLLWFHPAVWFVLSRIQLAREQVVDLEVVRLTGEPARYLDALVAVAAQRLRPDVVPAPLFLKKRQLAARVAAVLKETSMSKSRFVVSLATVSSAALIAVRTAVWLFPLQSPAQTPPETHGFFVADGTGISVDPGAPIMHRSPVPYPRGATATGTVVIQASVNSTGEVTDARVLSGPEELRKAALQSVLQWHYATEPAPPPLVQASIAFSQVPAAIPISQPVLPPPAVSHDRVLTGIQFSGVPPELQQKVREHLPVREGDQVSQDTISRTLAGVRDVDEHLTATTSPTPGNASGLTLSVVLEPYVPQAIRVGGNVQAANLIRKITPNYPPEAKAAHIEGKVRFTATIGQDGSITKLEVVSGDPTLVPAAQEAVKQWVYKPTLVNGQPVEVITQIDVNFTLLR